MRVLLVAYRFPPQSGGGVIRPLKFAKYLSRRGVPVTVLTVSPTPAMPQDASLLSDLPSDVRVVSVREKRRLPTPPAVRRAGSATDRLSRRAQVIARWAIVQGMVPDIAAGFIRAAAAAASHPDVRACDVVLATGGPWSSFLAGERIARTLARPLVLDYRDPWNTMFAGLKREFGAVAQWRNPILERRILARASAVVSVMEDFGAMLSARYGRIPPVHWIPNGFDPEDFDGVTARSEDAFVITYAGSIYGTRTIRPVVEALSELGRAGRVSLDRIRLRVLAPRPERVRAEFDGLDAARVVDTTGFLPHREALACLLGSTVNLLVDVIYDGPNVHVPGKMYEYLRAGRPILAISPAGKTAGLVHESGGGWVVPPGDAAALRETIAASYDAWSRGVALPQPSGAVIERFNRARQAERLAGVLAESLA